MPKDDPPKQAQLFSFATGRPIDSEIIESLGLLSRLADRAMAAGADPSASVSPDHELLMICDCIVMAKRQHDQLGATWRAMTYSNPDYERARAECYRASSTVRKLVMKLRKFPATTAAGIFAKAAAVSRTGSTAAAAAISLADDLLATPALRAAIWPASDRD